MRSFDQPIFCLIILISACTKVATWTNDVWENLFMPMLAIIQQGCILFSFTCYDRGNKEQFNTKICRTIDLRKHYLYFNWSRHLSYEISIKKLYHSHVIFILRKSLQWCSVIIQSTWNSSIIFINITSDNKLADISQIFLLRFSDWNIDDGARLAWKFF